MFPFFVISLALCIPLVAILAKSEIGHAIAEAIRHNSGASQIGANPQELEELRAEMEQVRAEMDEMHQQLGEANERIDFTERLLAAKNDTVPADVIK